MGEPHSAYRRTAPVHSSQPSAPQDQGQKTESLMHLASADRQLCFISSCALDSDLPDLRGRQRVLADVDSHEHPLVHGYSSNSAGTHFAAVPCCSIRALAYGIS